MGGLVLSPETFEWSDVLAAKVLMCLVHPRCGSLLPLTVLNVLVSVTTQHAPVGACINHLSKAQECCLSPPLQDCHAFGRCPHALFRLESHESPRVTSIT